MKLKNGHTTCRVHVDMWTVSNVQSVLSYGSLQKWMWHVA